MDRIAYRGRVWHNKHARRRILFFFISDQGCQGFCSDGFLSLDDALARLAVPVEVVGFLCQSKRLPEICSVLIFQLPLKSNHPGFLIGWPRNESFDLTLLLENSFANNSSYKVSFLITVSASQSRLSAKPSLVGRNSESWQLAEAAGVLLSTRTLSPPNRLSLLHKSRKPSSSAFLTTKLKSVWFLHGVFVQNAVS